MGAAAFLYGERGRAFLAVTWTWFSIAIILYVLRAASAVKQHSTGNALGIRWDFIWCTLAMGAAISAQIMYTISYNHALNGNQGLVTVAQVIYYGTIGSCAAQAASTLGRFAVVALLLSLQGPTYPKGKIALWFIAIAQLAVSSTQLALTVHQCDPTSRLWNIMEPGTCELIIMTRKYGFFAGSFGAFCDLFLALYPTVLIIGPLQQIDIKLKAVICAVMAGGAIAGVAAIVKTVQLANVLYVQYDYATIVIWVLTETWFIIIFGSITCTRPILIGLARHIKLFGSNFLTSTRRISIREKTAPTMVEMSQHHADPEDEYKGPTARMKDYHDLSDDELALNGSFAGHADHRPA